MFGRVNVQSFRRKRARYATPRAAAHAVRWRRRPTWSKIPVTRSPCTHPPGKGPGPSERRTGRQGRQQWQLTGGRCGSRTGGHRPDPGLADLLDPVALERRLQEARVRRAAALASRGAPNAPPAPPRSCARVGTPPPGRSPDAGPRGAGPGARTNRGARAPPRRRPPLAHLPRRARPWRRRRGARRPAGPAFPPRAAARRHAGRACERAARNDRLGPPPAGCLHARRPGRRRRRRQPLPLPPTGHHPGPAAQPAAGRASRSRPPMAFRHPPKPWPPR